MHTFEAKGVRFHHNSDLSGDVYIVNEQTDHTITVPGQSLLDFVAHYVRMKQIRVMEDMETEEILGLDTDSGC